MNGHAPRFGSSLTIHSRALIAALLLAACASPSATKPAPARQPTESKAPATAAAAPTTASDEYAQGLVSEALAHVSKLRQLPAKANVRGRVITRDDMVKFVRREIDEEVPPEVVAASTEILFALNTVPAGFDYKESLLELMKAQLAGFYVPREKTMFLGGDLGEPELQATLWHELVHALQDQYYNLDKALDWAPDKSDSLSAVHALAEGDATSAMIDAIYAERGMKATDIPDSLMNAQGALAIDVSTQVPGIIKRSLIAAYFDGLAFVNALRRAGGWQAVDAAWQKPPTSTEQLLHVDKFLKGEAPEAVSIPSALSGGPQTIALHDIYGEQTLRILFEEWMPARTARECAEQWAGDRIALFSDGKRMAVGWRIRFDTEAAAKRALVAFARGALSAEDPKPGANGRLAEVAPLPLAEKAAHAGQLCHERHTRGPFAAVLRGREVTITLGPYERTGAVVRSAGNCGQALGWATKISREP
jgi:hypothetical protein